MNIPRLKYAIKKTWFAYVGMLVLSVPVIWLQTTMPFEPISTLSPTLRTLQMVTYAMAVISDIVLVASFCMFGYYTRRYYMEEVEDRKFFISLRRQNRKFKREFSQLIQEISRRQMS